MTDASDAPDDITGRSAFTGAGASTAEFASLTSGGDQAGARRESDSGTALYVSPSGDDGNDGSMAAPFFTLERARDAIRALKQASGLPVGGVTVFLRGGRHERSSSFALQAQDSGAAGSPVVYRGYEGELAEIVGSAVLDPAAFDSVTDPAVLARLAPEARGNVMQLSLPSQGVADHGTMAPRGGARAAYPSLVPPATPQLIVDDSWMTLARWPNAGYTAMGEIIDPGTTGNLRFKHTDDRPNHWASADDAWLFTYAAYNWAYEVMSITAVDTTTSTITCGQRTRYGAREGGRYYYFNVLEELDAPGEWYLDRSTGMLYLYPPSNLASASIRLTQLDTPLVTMTSTDHVSFEHLTFGETRDAAVTSTGGSHNRVSSCSLAFVGNWAVIFAGGTDNGVAGCQVHDTGVGAVVIDSGDRPTLTPGGGFVQDTHIHSFSQWQPDYAPAVLVAGVGNRVARNEIHNAPHTAVMFSGNDHIIEGNEIHHVVLDTTDSGAINAGRDWTWRGTVIRHNYLHDITNDVSAAGGYDVPVGVYLDDGLSETHIIGNIFENVDMAIHLHGGRDNVVDNNIILRCGQTIMIDDPIATSLPTMTESLTTMPYQQEPWTTHYPALVTILDDEPLVPKGNTVIRTVLAASGPPYYSADVPAVSTFKDNWTTSSPDLGFIDIDRTCHYLAQTSPVVANIADFAVIPSGLIGPLSTTVLFRRTGELIVAYAGTGDVQAPLATELDRTVSQAQDALGQGDTQTTAANLIRMRTSVATASRRARGAQAACSTIAATALTTLVNTLLASVSGDTSADVAAAPSSTRHATQHRRC